MKEIWIFGEDKTSDMSRWSINAFENAVSLRLALVRYWSHSQMETHPHRLEGFNRPHVIININEPNPWLEEKQCIYGTLNEAKVINLY
jgi:hypothetical protein